jgi:hypothetical protein
VLLLAAAPPLRQRGRFSVRFLGCGTPHTQDPSTSIANARFGRDDTLGGAALQRCIKGGVRGAASAAEAPQGMKP